MLPSAETAAILFWALLASGQITMRKVDGWQSLDELPAAASPVDVAAWAGSLALPEARRSGHFHTTRDGTQDAFAAEYRRRAGIDGTLSAAVRAMHLRRARYVGLAKTHLQHVLTTAAINLVRLGAWLAGEPLARTRRSAFKRLMREPVYV